MEISWRRQQRENPSPQTSIKSKGSNSRNNNNGLHIPIPPLTPKSISRYETNPYPTTFIQANTTSFKQVVQMLTGTPGTAEQASKSPTSSDSLLPLRNCIPPIKTGQKKQSFKLYERRNNLKNGLMISPLGQNSGIFTQQADILSPSTLDFPSLVLSPAMPLIEDPLNKSSPFKVNSSSSSEEEKAMAEKGYYLHPSPRTTTPKGSEPLLLPLFPMTSTRVSDSCS